MTIQEDPGWWPSLRRLWRHWVALVVSVMGLRARPVETKGLILLRSVFLVLVAALLLFVVLLSHRTLGRRRRAVGPVGGRHYRDRLARLCRPDPTAAASDDLAGDPCTLLPSIVLHRVGVASAAALWGFVEVFLGGSLWIYLVGLAFGLVGLGMIAPARRDIERRQREITAAWSPLSLLDALISVPWP